MSNNITVTVDSSQENIEVLLSTSVDNGLPSGGNTGDVLVKLSNSSYDTGWSTVVNTDLSFIAGAGDGTVASSTGDDAIIPAATETEAGLFLPEEKTKLAEIVTDGSETDQHIHDDRYYTEDEIDAVIGDKLNKSGDTLSTTDGTGFIGLPSQSSSVATPASGVRIFANTSGNLSWVGQDGFSRSVAGTLSANRIYAVPNEAGTFALTNDGQVINGIAHFIRATKPTVRVDGSSLVVRDRWYNTTDGTAWFWSGLFWLSEKRSISSQTYTFSSSSTQDPILFPNFSYNYLAASVDFVGHISGTVSNPSSNYWTITVSKRNASAVQSFAVPIVLSTQGFSYTNGDTIRRTQSIDEVLFVSSTVNLGNSSISAARGLYISVAKIGTPPNITGGIAFSYHLIAP